MRGTLSLRGRASLGLLTCALFLQAGGIASAGPEDTVRDLLLRADNFIATGVSPTTVFFRWENHSLLNGVGGQNVGGVAVPPPATVKFRLESATDEAGPYTTLRSVGSCGIICFSSASLGPASDPTPRFFRVVPVLETPAGTLEGRPSLVDPAFLGPQPPTNLRCNGIVLCQGVTSVTLTWTDNSDESEFWVMRAKGTVQPPQYGTSPIVKLPANVTTFTDGGLDLDSIYHYKVVAVREQNIVRLDPPEGPGGVTTEQSFSDGVSPKDVRVETPPIPPPFDPQSLVAQFIPPSTARLTWTDTANNEDGFFIEWGPASDDYEFMLSRYPSPGLGTVTWNDPTLPPDTNRCFRVRAYRFGPAYSAYTQPACIGSAPRAPSNLTAVAVSNALVNLAWLDNSASENAFVVERCEGSCSATAPGWETIAEDAPANVTTFADTTTVALTTYSYRVRAKNFSGVSAPSNIAVVTTKAAPLPAPTNVTATGTGSHQITVTFVDASTNETGFKLEFLNPDLEWEQLVVLPARSGAGSTVTHIDTESLATNQTRCYRARAIKGAEQSDPSPPDGVCASTLGPLLPNGAPSGLGGTVISNYRIDLAWTDNSTNEETFRVEYSLFDNEACGAQVPATTSWRTFATVQPVDSDDVPYPPNQTGPRAFSATGLIPHTAYFFRVFAVNQDGVAGPSNVTGCHQTFGPPKPVFLDPAENGNVQATRCTVDIQAPSIGVDAASRIRLYVVANLPGYGPYLTEELKGDQAPAPITPGSSTWRARYQFRKGFTYGLIATSFGLGPTFYQSVDARLRDIQVLADCPIEPDPLP